jgi:Short C-terminal domain
MPFMRRRPLLRAAAVGGGAYMVGKSRARSQDQAAAYQDEQDQRISSLEQQQAPAPAAAAPDAGGMSEDTISKLKQLGDLHNAGVLTDEEFAAQKEKLLA